MGRIDKSFNVFITTYQFSRTTYQEKKLENRLDFIFLKIREVKNMHPYFGVENVLSQIAKQ